MKCKNCGGSYRTIEMKCPYCGTENRLGRIWLAQRSEAEQAYEEARKKNNKSYSPYVLNRWLNRAIFVTVLIGIAVFIMMFVYALVFYNSSSVRYARHKEEVEAELRSYYETGDYQKLRSALERYDVYDEEHYDYAQISSLYYDYREFCVERFRTIECMEKDEDYLDHYVPMALRRGRKVVCVHQGLYSDLSEANRAAYDDWCEDIEGFCKGYLGMTEEEWADYANAEEYVYPHDEMAKMLITRFTEKEGEEDG
ncbi:MAG: hypothetical protein K6G07_07050 [Lachnospiraceae bacterium]|nr:hypothetical protein [Lachnospiraceae bacterium]